MTLTTKTEARFVELIGTGEKIKATNRLHEFSGYEFVDEPQACASGR